MIIACPACNTRYVVPDEAIGVEGRTVRCAKCKHNWYQDGPELEERAEQAAAPVAEPTPEPEPAPEPEPTPEPEPAPDEAAPVEAQGGDVASEDTAPAQPSVSHWRTSDQETDEGAAEDDTSDEAVPAAPPAYEEPAAEEDEPQEAPASDPVAAYADTSEAEHSQFDYEPPFRARRNPLKMWTAAGVVFALLAFGTIIGVNYWGLPDWVPVDRPTFAVEEPDLVLDFPGDQQDRRTLPNGTEYFGASGTITNIGRETVNVPSILIILRDEQDRIVYNWEVAPPQPTLAPGETLTIKEAVTDVPRSAKFAEIGWKPA
ncbi:MAG: MJ0042-type zinc finger domain-containing protein [Erythrobacter sp.]